MDIRTLTYFLEIAKVQNITKAAENLHMSQPPLSRQMQLLEEELGVQLLIRGKRKVTLTQEGVFLRERAEQLITFTNKTIEQISSIGNRVTGKIYIGSIESISVGIMPKWITAFHEKYPEVLYDWWSGNSNEVLEKLEKGLIDIAVVRTPCNNEKFYTISLFKEPWMLYLNKDSDLAKEKGITISLDRLRDVPIIIPSIKTRSKQIREWFHKRDMEPNICCEISPAMNAISLVEEKMGAAILPESALRATVGKNIVMKQIVNPTMESEIIIAYNRGEQLSVAAEKFVEFVCDAMKEKGTN